MKNNKKATAAATPEKIAGVSGQSNKNVKPKTQTTKKGVGGLEQHGSIKNSK